MLIRNPSLAKRQPAPSGSRLIRCPDAGGTVAKLGSDLTKPAHDEIAIQTKAGEKHFTRDTARVAAMRGYARADPQCLKGQA